ncbi:MAG: hypothetical protein ACRECF_06550 [Methyloceanibacter sp.]
MLERIQTPYSVGAADAADRLRLIGCDLRVTDLAVQRAVDNSDDREALSMHVRRTIGDVELLSDDILTRDKEGRVQ